MSSIGIHTRAKPACLIVGVSDLADLEQVLGSMCMLKLALDVRVLGCIIPARIYITPHINYRKRCKKTI